MARPWHEAHDARPLIAGAWIRPDHYGDPGPPRSGTCGARSAIIDVTPIGKLDLRGVPTCRGCSNLVYVNKWSQGSASAGSRYGVMVAPRTAWSFDDGVHRPPWARSTT